MIVLVLFIITNQQYNQQWQGKNQIFCQDRQNMAQTIHQYGVYSVLPTFL